jgi:hypothetical protein
MKLDHSFQHLKTARCLPTLCRNHLNDLKTQPDTSASSKQLSLAIVLAWSPLRISIVVLGPVLLSLAVGLWFQARDPTDLATIQTASAIASYIFTARSCGLPSCESLDHC